MAACEGPDRLRDQLEVFRDERGTLTVAELDSLPFVPARAYVLHGIPAGSSGPVTPTGASSNGSP